MQQQNVQCISRWQTFRDGTFDNHRVGEYYFYSFVGILCEKMLGKIKSLLPLWEQIKSLFDKGICGFWNKDLFFLKSSVDLCRLAVLIILCTHWITTQL